MAENKSITKDMPPDIIERDIAKVRGEITETISQIEERLSVGHWKWVMKEKVRSKALSAASRGKQLAGRAKDSASRIGLAAQDSASKATNRVLQFVKDDPVAARIIAFELGALIAAVWQDQNKKKMKKETDTTLLLAEESAVQTIEGVQQPAKREVQVQKEQFKKAA